MKTQIAIIGAGPAGLSLAQFLQQKGISSVVIERSSREHVEQRLRAGVLEPGTVEMLTNAGVGERMHAQGLVHHGVGIIFNETLHRLDLKSSGGKPVMVYGQTEITKDLINARLAQQGETIFDAQNVELQRFDGQKPSVTYTKEDERYTVECDFIAGCDGFHGVSRKHFPAEAIGKHDKEYPYAWFGILAEAKPLSNEIIYANSPGPDGGFALYSMRSPERSRNYFQCDPTTNVANWSDDQIWDRLQAHIGQADLPPLSHGTILEKSVTPMRSSIVNEMRFNKLFLAGDAAHIMPPTGAKGLNLAVSDAHDLATAFADHYINNNHNKMLERYSGTCLERARKTLDFAVYLTELLHKPGQNNETAYKRQMAELTSIFASDDKSKMVAQQYLGIY